ncbi:MAG: MFS transporter, partial [Acetobacteraceae bacterium]
MVVEQSMMRISGGATAARHNEAAPDGSEDDAPGAATSGTTAGMTSNPAAPAAIQQDANPGWPLTLWTMVGVQLVMSISFTILSPIMPLFLPDLGVHEASRIDLWAGILAAVSPMVGVFTSPIWGRMADRYGRKLMVLRSTFGIAVFTALMGVALTVWHMLAFRLMMGLFAGFSSAAIALVASQV